MLALGVETSGECGGTALLKDDRIDAITLDRGRLYGGYLAISIKQLLDRNGINSFADLDVIGISTGPGSYTGLRVGMAVVKGICLAAGVPVTGISTHLAIATGVFKTRLDVNKIAVLTNARLNQLFLSVYERKYDSVNVLSDTTAFSYEDAIARLPNRVLLAGDGVELIKKRLTDGSFEFADETLAYPSHVVIAELAVKIHIDGEYDDVYTIVPRYFRRTEAEIKMQGCVTDEKI